MDDDRAFLAVARQVLECSQPPFEVHSARTGEAALTFLDRCVMLTSQLLPAFVILDFRLPDMNAPKVLESMRARAELRGLPVLVLTQTPRKGDEVEARAAGALDYRVKPSTVSGLRDAFLEFWQSHGPDRRRGGGRAR